MVNTRLYESLKGLINIYVINMLSLKMRGITITLSKNLSVFTSCLDVGGGEDSTTGTGKLR